MSYKVGFGYSLKGMAILDQALLGYDLQGRTWLPLTN